MTPWPPSYYRGYAEVLFLSLGSGVVVRALALDSEVAFGHRDICIGLPAAIVRIGCLDGLRLIPAQVLSATA
jgi:hypothetical protein